MPSAKKNDISVSEDLLHLVCDSIAEGVIVVDASGHVILMNRTAREVSGEPPRDTPLERVPKIYGVYRLDGVTEFPWEELPIVRALKGEPVTGLRMFVRNARHPSGIVFEVNARPLIAKDGSMRGAVSTYRDVTENQRMQTELDKRTAELVRSNKDLDLFASMASHELQEPVRKITAFGELLRQSAKGLSESSAEYLARMHSAAERMGRLIDVLLEYSRVATHANTPAPVDLDELVREAIEDLDLDGAKIEVGKLGRVRADAPQVERLFRNLLSNALKFRKPDQPARVRVSARPVPGFVEVRVEDEGIGFEPEHAEEIFKPFNRLHGRGEYPGSGMGLTLCERIIVRHGGTIRAEGRPGKGATFTFTLPAEGP